MKQGPASLTGGMPESDSRGDQCLPGYRHFRGDALGCTAVGESIDGVQDPVRNPARKVLQLGAIAPNEALVTGELLQVEPIDSSTLAIAPPQMLTRIRLRLVTTRDIGSSLNPLRGQEGQILEAYSKAPVASNLIIGKLVTGKIIYRGDERRGLYWIYDLQEAGRE